MKLLKASALFSLCLGLNAEPWYGFCIVEQGHQRVCSAPEEKIGDFSPICDSFADALGEYGWSARFSNSLKYLKYSMPDFCDAINDGKDSSFYACQVAVLCPGEVEELRHLASRVYASDQSEAQNACLEKEHDRYHREFQDQSQNGCFVRVAVEALR